MKSISTENVILYHKKIVYATGGSLEIRDVGLIESAINRGIMTFDGKYLYETTIEKVSAITHSLIKNHAFVDGNKRIGVAVMILLLRLNKIEVKYTQQELIQLGLKIAEGRKEITHIVKWIIDHRV